MGILEQREGGRRFSLPSRFLVGRHAGCDVWLEDKRISKEHVSLHWLGHGWELRDLGSSNGTFVEGQPLKPGERRALEQGQGFVLGTGLASFQLVDASPPAARARRLAIPQVREALGSLLLLPDDDEPQVSLFLDGLGRWVLEAGEVQRNVVDQERLRVGGDEWLLELPTATERTQEEGLTPLDHIQLRIGVSLDEEHVVVTVLHGPHETVLPPRAYHYLLATLARERLKDLQAPEAERGWVERERLCRMLATDSNKLNVDIHRARQQLSTLGIQDAANLVERRSGTGHVRLGIREVAVFSL